MFLQNADFETDQKTRKEPPRRVRLYQKLDYKLVYFEQFTLILHPILTTGEATLNWAQNLFFDGCPPSPKRPRRKSCWEPKPTDENARQFCPDGGSLNFEQPTSFLPCFTKNAANFKPCRMLRRKSFQSQKPRNLLNFAPRFPRRIFGRAMGNFRRRNGLHHHLSSAQCHNFRQFFLVQSADFFGLIFQKAMEQFLAQKSM